MVQFQTGLHAVEFLELDEAEAAASVRVLLLGRHAHGDWGDLGEVLGDGRSGGGVREVS